MANLSRPFSPKYFAAIEEGKRHHASSKTYSGKFLRPHKAAVARIIAETPIRNALDYGSGKGAQYRWVDPADGLTLEESWGFPVRCYDPCWPPYAEEPECVFDMVICTHTLSLIPMEDVDLVVERLFSLAGKVVFIAEKIGGRKKAEVGEPDERAIGWGALQWLEFIAPFADLHPDRLTVFSARERCHEGVRVMRFERKDGRWLLLA